MQRPQTQQTADHNLCHFFVHENRETKEPAEFVAHPEGTHLLRGPGLSEVEVPAAVERDEQALNEAAARGGVPELVVQHRKKAEHVV